MGISMPISLAILYTTSWRLWGAKLHDAAAQDPSPGEHLRAGCPLSGANAVNWIGVLKCMLNFDTRFNADVSSS